MKYLKINNYATVNGTCDYKGLNIDDFMVGTQVYSDLSYCLVGTSEDVIPVHVDIEEITYEQYEEYKGSTPAPFDPFGEIRKENEALKKSQADQDELIMELYLGGM